MRLIKKSIFFAIIAFIAISCNSSGQQQQDVTRVQSLLKEKAKIHLTKEEIELKRYETETAMDDWSEYYEINIPDSSHAKALSFVKQDTSWKEIEKAYQLLIFIDDEDKLGYTGYIFAISKGENNISVQVTKE